MHVRHAHHGCASIYGQICMFLYMQKLGTTTQMGLHCENRENSGHKSRAARQVRMRLARVARAWHGAHTRFPVHVDSCTVTYINIIGIKNDGGACHGGLCHQNMRRPAIISGRSPARPSCASLPGLPCLSLASHPTTNIKHLFANILGV